MFLFRGASVVERETLEAELDAMGAGVVYDFQLANAFNEGVAQLLGDDADGIAQLKDIRAAADSEGRTALSVPDRATLDGAEAVLTEHWPPYAALVRRSSRRHALQPVLAFQRWCVGWENVPHASGEGEAVHARGFDGHVSEAALKSIDPMMLRIAGSEAWQLQQGAGAQAKNSEAGSNADGDPPISSSAKDGVAG
ncbi:hypothetical protein ABC347_10935 [Sphingomonas sp. 1P06PA]|uniref:hypothetical protein n=1 Tax=Sphingomonas sp. 1P06PA TaxID=554121 RepID=UPI0039A564A8